ncbi:MAG: transglutaminase domain-containing protein [Chlorobium sp.]|nr:transglutaminase domain-containing protein [Chlorobium sp.]
MNKRNLIFLITLFMMSATTVWAKTLIVEGKLDGTVTVKRNVTFSAVQTVTQFTYQFSVPSVYDNAGNIQRLDDFQVSASPQPSEAKETTDHYGNRFRKLTWNKLQSDAQVTISYTTGITATISSRTSRAPFPLLTVPKSEQGFLKSSKLAESDAHQVIDLARELTAGAKSEHQAVTAILTHVADAIKYQYNPKQFDALFGLTTGTGNCQNFSHLAIALLRASGIPARVSIGQALKNKWKIPLDNNGSSLVQGMGEGLHAWIEVWYPDLGWLPCDPQQSSLFTSTRHIKFGHGMDASDVREYWSAAPVLPRMSESFAATYSTDTVKLRLRESLDQPISYLLAGQVNSVAIAPEEPPAIKPKPVLLPLPPKPKRLLIKPKPVPSKLKPGTPVEIGNRDFPTMVEIYQIDGNVGQRSYDRETAEYATSKTLFAQAFTLDVPLSLKDAGLAMRKFGGDGMVYIDIVHDEGGKPSLDGVRSMPVSLEKITRKPGYYWVDFTQPQKTTLAPGKYWLVLRHSGEVIMNWFYTPGKRVGGPDDSRSTALGWQWEDVLAGEFVYRVRGVVGK